jgi:hypothetical protein
VAYQLGLCTHEQAEHLQARLDLRDRTPEVARSETDARRAADAWTDARGWWAKCLEYAREDAPKDAPKESRNAILLAVRILLARTEAMRGNRAAATALLEDLSGGMTAQEKVANLYRARQLKK